MMQEKKDCELCSCRAEMCRVYGIKDKENGEAREGLHVFQMDKDPETSKKGAKYWTMASPAQAFNFMQKHNLPHFYETYYFPFRQVRFPVDLDIPDKEGFKYHIETFTTFLIEAWNEIVPNQKITQQNLLWARTETQPGKNSVHIIVDKYYFQDIRYCLTLYRKLEDYFVEHSDQDKLDQYVYKNERYLKDIPDIGKYIEGYFSLYPKERKRAYLRRIIGFDSCIYGKRCLRTLYSTKRGKNFPLYRWYPEKEFEKLPSCEQHDFVSFKNFLITYIPDDCKKVNMELPNKKNPVTRRRRNPPQAKGKHEDVILTSRQKIPKTSKRYIPPKMLREMIVEYLPKEYSIEYSTWRDTGYILKNYQRDYNIDSENIFNIFYEFSQKSPNCPSRAEVRDFYDHKMDLNKTEEKITFLSLIYWVKKVIVEQATTLNLKKLTPNLKVIKTSSRYFTLTDKYMISDRTPGLVFVISNPGTGKTTTIAKRLKGKKVICLSYRRSLASQLMESLGKEGIEVVSYRDPDEHKWQGAGAVVCQLDSIHKLQELKGMKGYILWLDELSGLLNYLCTSDTLKGKVVPVMKDFFQILRNAKEIIMSDADIREGEIELMRKLCPEKVSVVYHNKYHVKRGVTCEISECTYRNVIDKGLKIMHDLRASMEEIGQSGLTVLVASDSVKLLEKIRMMMGATTVEEKVYTKREGNLDRDIGTINEEWCGKVVYYSPTIVTGVDYVGECVIYGFYTGKSLTAHEFVQQVSRGRNPKKMSILMCGYERVPRQLTFESYMKMMEQREDHLRRVCEWERKMIIPMCYLPKKCQWMGDKISLLREYGYRCEYERSKEIGCHQEILREVLKKRGYDVVEVKENIYDESIMNLGQYEVDNDHETDLLCESLVKYGSICVDRVYYEEYQKMCHEAHSHGYLRDKEGDPASVGLDLCGYYDNWVNSAEYEECEREDLRACTRRADMRQCLNGKDKVKIVFVVYLEKLYDQMMRRANFLRVDLLESAYAKIKKGDSFLWDILKDEEGLQRHYKVCNYEEKNGDLFVQRIRNEYKEQRIDNVWKSLNVHYKEILDIETMLEIGDRDSLSYEFLREHYGKELKEVDEAYLKGILQNLNLKMTRRMSKQILIWDDVYELLRKVWRKYWNKTGILQEFEKKRIMVNRESKKYYSFQRPVFDEKLIKRHTTLHPSPHHIKNPKN